MHLWLKVLAVPPNKWETWGFVSAWGTAAGKKQSLHFESAWGQNLLLQTAQLYKLHKHFVRNLVQQPAAVYMRKWNGWFPCMIKSMLNNNEEASGRDLPLPSPLLFAFSYQKCTRRLLLCLWLRTESYNMISWHCHRFVVCSLNLSVFWIPSDLTKGFCL